MKERERDKLLYSKYGSVVTVWFYSNTVREPTCGISISLDMLRSFITAMVYCQ